MIINKRNKNYLMVESTKNLNFFKNKKELFKILSKIESIKQRNNKMYDYYMGNQEIAILKNKKNNEIKNVSILNLLDDNVNQKISVGFGSDAKIIYDDNAGDIVDIIAKVNKSNSSYKTLYNHAVTAAITGVSYELITHQNNNIKYNYIDNSNILPLCDNSIIVNISVVLYLLTKNDDYIDFLVYDDKKIQKVRIKDDTLEILDEELHNYGIIPIIPYYSDIYGIGDIEKLIPLQDSLNNLLTFVQNEHEIIDRKILHIKGDADLGLSDYDADNTNDIDTGLPYDMPVQNKKIKKETGESIRDKIFESAVINTPTGVDLGFLESKNNLENTFEMIRDLKNEIRKEFAHDYDNVSDVTSGIALKMRYGPLIANLNDNIQLFVDSLNYRYQAVFNFYKKDNKIKEIIIKAEIPEDESENIKNIISLYNNGLLSKNTALSKLKMIKNANEEIKKIKEEEGTSYDDF